MPGKASGTANSKEKRSLIVWLILAVPLVLALILFTAPSCTPEAERVADTDDVRRSATAASVTGTEAVNRQIVGGVVCPPFSAKEERTCTFDEQPTQGIGSLVGGRKQCLSAAHGPGSQFNFQRWDSGVNDWVDIPPQGEPSTVKRDQVRFVGLTSEQPVTVRYWLGENDSCEPTPVKRAEELAVTKTAAIQPETSSSSATQLETKDEKSSLYTTDPGWTKPPVGRSPQEYEREMPR